MRPRGRCSPPPIEPHQHCLLGANPLHCHAPFAAKAQRRHQQRRQNQPRHPLVKISKSVPLAYLQLKITIYRVLSRIGTASILFALCHISLVCVC
jgi:hypothetical protein